MKITIDKLRQIIKEEISSLSEGGMKDTVIIPPVKQRPVHVPLGKKRLPAGLSIQDVLDSMTPEQREEMRQALQISK